jgi:hypothetical protein
MHPEPAAAGTKLRVEPLSHLPPPHLEWYHLRDVRFPAREVREAKYCRPEVLQVRSLLPLRNRPSAAREAAPDDEGAPEADR